jgi:hypothetical protein
MFFSLLLFVSVCTAQFSQFVDPFIGTGGLGYGAASVPPGKENQVFLWEQKKKKKRRFFFFCFLAFVSLHHLCLMLHPS